ncbi:MAG: hypothetical protein II680_01660 [Clostridia bacterium]|nr:hypothetical protein [Clostridia bacterium]
MKRFSLLLGAMVFSLILVFAGCERGAAGPSTAPPDTAASGQNEKQDPEPGGENAGKTDGSEAPEEPESDVLTIVRGDNSSAAVTEAAKSLRKLLESRNFQVDIKTDWVKRGEEIKPFPNEILIGPTNRPASEELYARMAETGEIYDYFIQFGAVNCIAATDECVGEAAELFADEYAALRTAGNTEVTKEMERLHVFPARGMTLCGMDLAEWSIVCPVVYHKEDRAELELLASLFYEACGVRPAVVGASETIPTSHAILFGTASKLTPREWDLSYIVHFDGKDLHIGGGNLWADLRALYNELIYGALGAGIDRSMPDPPLSIEFEDKTVPDVNGHRAFSVSAWVTSGDAYETEAQVKETAEAGFTKISVGGLTNEGLRRNIMKWCAIYDLEILWADAHYTSIGENFWTRWSSGLDAPHVWGLYLCDEPNSSIFPDLAKCAKEVAGESLQVPFINLFPNYANQQQLGNRNYEEHIDEFFSTVEPPYASVDIYPCDTTGLYGGYMDNLDVFASACRRTKTPFSVYLQSVSFAASKRTPSEKDLEWQTWCIRSFGAAEAIYFTYMTPYSTAEDFKPALIDHNLERTDRWYAAQKINGEFAALDPAFARYPENLGAFTVNASGTNVSEAFMRFGNQYDFSAVLEEIDSEAPLLFGCFTDGADGYAFTVVSCQNLLRDKTADMRLKIAGKALTVWQNGKSTRLEPDGEGYITISLACGEGAFCEVEQ